MRIKIQKTWIYEICVKQYKLYKINLKLITIQVVDELETLEKEAAYDYLKVEKEMN